MSVDARRELLLIDAIDACPACSRLFPIVCPAHRSFAIRLAFDRRDPCQPV